MLYIYNIKFDYIQYLYSKDNNVYYSNKENYDRKPYIGFVVNINNRLYAIPMTSPKTKHLKMKNAEDFHKIDEGKLGALNINNMIPVEESPLILEKVDVLKLMTSDDPEDVQYGNLLNKQISFINSNEQRISIENKAYDLYVSYKLGTLPERIFGRCNQFGILEQALTDFIEIKNNESR